jgi:general secretion pathway protein D
VDILLFVKFISEVTGKNFVIDEKVKGKVTIVSPTKISVDEAYRVFESVLEVHGFTTVEAGSITKIVPSVTARGKSIETRLREEIDNPDDRVVTQIIRLDYANPDELKRLFAPLISKSSVIVSYPPTNMLLVTDVLSNIKRLLRIIRAIDVVGIGEEISVVPLEHAISSVMVKTLMSIFKTGSTPTRRGKRSAAAIAPEIEIVADERTNSLIISASEHDTYRIKQLVKILDQETPRGAGDIRVYYLQYADAEELAKVLTALPSKGAKDPKTGKAPVISKEVQIVADKATNSLVITANKQDYLILMDVISKLDISRPMVYIEALIMEVKATKDFSLGVKWQVADDVGTWEDRTIGAFASSGAGVEGGLLAQATAPKGLSFGVVGEGITISTGVGDITFPTIGAMVRAFHSDSDVHILQTPQILTTDNEEAEIKVADNVPYLTKEATGEQQYQTYEYKDVGVTLKITPQINQERFVRLKIFQE